MSRREGAWVICRVRFLGCIRTRMGIDSTGTAISRGCDDGYRSTRCPTAAHPQTGLWPACPAPAAPTLTGLPSCRGGGSRQFRGKQPPGPRDDARSAGRARSRRRSAGSGLRMGTRPPAVAWCPLCNAGRDGLSRCVKVRSSARRRWQVASIARRCSRAVID